MYVLKQNLCVILILKVRKYNISVLNCTLCIGYFLFITTFFCPRTAMWLLFYGREGGGHLLFGRGDTGDCNNKLCVPCTWNCKIVRFWFNLHCHKKSSSSEFLKTYGKILSPLWNSFLFYFLISLMGLYVVISLSNYEFLYVRFTNKEF